MENYIRLNVRMMCPFYHPPPCRTPTMTPTARRISGSLAFPFLQSPYLGQGSAPMQLIVSTPVRYEKPGTASGGATVKPEAGRVTV